MSYVRKFAQLVLALFRELSDETAYTRYLNGRAPSGDEWRKFSEARHRAKFMRAKCC